MNKYSVVMVFVSSILTLQQKIYKIMIIKSKITGRDISTEYLGLLSGLITNDEFELITLTVK